MNCSPCIAICLVVHAETEDLFYALNHFAIDFTDIDYHLVKESIQKQPA
jgi:hypothetical protein